MLEVRWHGRGGQGAKTAAQFLAESALESGKYIQAFPEYGPERSGAPIRAFTRIDEAPINIHSGVVSPDVVIVIDPTLLNSIDVTEGLKEDGVLLVNAQEEPKAIRDRFGFNKGKVATVDATRISLDTLGRSMPNTPMLGALVKVKSVVSIDALIDRIRDKFLKKIGQEKTDANIAGVRRAYEEVRIG